MYIQFCDSNSVTGIVIDFISISVGIVISTPWFNYKVTTGIIIEEGGAILPLQHQCEHS